VRTRNRIRLKHAEREAEGYLELGMAQHALDTLARLGEPANFSGHAYYLCGEALRSQRKYAEALEPLTKAANASPGDIHIWLALGWCHKRLRRLDLAVAAMEQALEAEPEDALVHYNLACYLSLATQKERAILHLAKALSIDPEFRNLIDAEQDFDPIRSDPEFQALTSIAV
jgi:tetratricopeptide (TPR) repeat protein